MVIAASSIWRCDRRCRPIAVACCMLISANVRAQQQVNVQAQQHADHQLGKVVFTVSCSAATQTQFNRAVALLHHMTYPQARQAFEEIVATDPQCAMAHWGIAMTLFQPLWPTRPRPDELRRGWESIQKAKALGLRSDAEKLFVVAAESFFLEPASRDYWPRIQRWEQASRDAFTKLPANDEAAVFFALAHLAAAPSDTTSRAYADQSADILMQVYARNPDHPGVMHYLVHANDVPGRERKLLDITRKYQQIAPRNPHALHMPTHIYTRIGDWDAVISGNIAAAAAALEHPAGANREFVWDEFPHALEYLVYARLQQGTDDSARAELQQLQKTERLEPTFKTAFHLASIQARYALERHAWNEATQIVPRQPATLEWDRFAWPEAISWFARGLGSLHTGNSSETKTAIARLAALDSAMSKAGEQLFARNIRTLQLELSAWLSNAEGRFDDAIRLMREASALEASTPKHAVTPGPTLPAEELLGDLLMAQKQPARAIDAYTRSLERYPKRFNSLLGLARAAREAGNVSRAREAYRELLDVAGRGTRAAELQEAKRFVAR